MGVFKRFSDVPDHRRLSRYEDEYADRDVWTEFCENYEYDQGSTKSHRKEVNRVGDAWCTFTDERGVHHALASPTDVEAWCNELLAEKSTRRAYDYWLRIRRFYDWLQWHVDHPHVYNPVLFAVVEGDAAREIWYEKIARWEEARARYERRSDG